MIYQDAVLIQDELNEFDVSFFAGKDERGLAFFGFLAVYVCACIQEIVHYLDGL